MAPKQKRDPAPLGEASKEEHRKHATEFLSRPEHNVKPKGFPEPGHEWDDPPPDKE